MSKPRFFWYHVVKQVAKWSLRGMLPDDCWLLIFINSCVKTAYESELYHSEVVRCLM